MQTTETNIPDLAKAGPILFRTLINIFDGWGLKTCDRMVLMGMTNEKTYYNRVNKPETVRVTPDFIERGSYLLGIFKALEILFPDPKLADSWLTNPNDNPLFNGQAPIERMLGGKVTDLSLVRRHLDQVRGGAIG